MRSLSLGLVAATFLQEATVLGASSLLRRQSDSACAALSEQVQQLTQQNRTAAVEGQDAYNCLKEIPFNSTAGVAFVQELRKHIEFQADLETLQEPPQSSSQGPIDILAGLSDIEQKAGDNAYDGQFDFDMDISALLNSAHDGHLGIQGLCTNSIFSFDLTTALISVSNSSTSQPEIYETEAVQQAANSSDSTLSPIASIEGGDPVEFLSKYADFITLQDADARYNALFTSFARRGAITTLRGIFATHNGIWPGYSSINYTYANGTESAWSSRARVGHQLSYNYSSGQELYEAFCAPLTQPSSTANGTSSTNTTGTSKPSVAPTQSAGPDSLPTPVLRDPYNTLSGYYLDEADYSDTAVLFVPDFATNGADPYTGLDVPNNQTAVFAQVASDFLTQATSEGKTRLIIDLSGNGGGTTLTGYNLFKLLFPTTDIYSANRYRHHPFLSLLMEALTNYTEDYDDASTYYLPRHFAWEAQLNPDQSPTNFTSWSDFYSTTNSNNLTAPVAFTNFTAQSTDISPIQGYSNITTTFPSPPFAPENITIITDGFCASTCSIFVELLQSYGNVTNTVVFGGLPSTKPMQLVGGTRGTEEYTFSTLADAANETLSYMHKRLNESKPTLNEADRQRLGELMPTHPETWPIQVGGGSVNLRNGYRSSDEDAVPLQFLSDEASCRLFYMVENVLKPATVWRAAAGAIWGGEECVARGKGVEGSNAESAASESEKQKNAGCVSNVGMGGLVAAVAAVMAVVGM